ncbi:MAG: hypothetical protein QG656_291, partial [Candidatus Hydrogenedentes bacterium]|nr:hypothetical protein [Candidatus Hydrogenedentota bacterium]
VILSQRSRRAVNNVVNCGAADWLFKDQVSAVLGRVVRYTLERQSPDKRLQEQRMVFKAILTGFPGFLALKNGDGVFQAVNPAFSQFLGKGPEEIVGKTDLDLFPKKEAEVLNKADKKVLQSGVTQTEVHAVTMPDGTHWIEASRSPILDPEGEITGLLWTARDITEFKGMEDSVRQIHDNYATLAEDQTELACRFQGDYALTFVNEPLCRFLNKEQDELMGKSFLEIMPEEEVDELKNLLAAVSAKKPVATREMGAVSAAGDICWQQWTLRALFAEGGAAAGYQAVGRDISSERRAQDELASSKDQAAQLQKQAAEKDKERQALTATLAEKDKERQALTASVTEAEARIKDGEARLREALDLFPSPFCELGGGMRVIFFNRAGLTAFGLTEKDVAAGVTLTDLFHPDDKARATETFRATADGKSAAPAEYRLRLKNGSEKKIQLFCGPVKHEGHIAGLQCCLVDQVGREQMENALAAASHMAETAAEAATLNQGVIAFMATTLQRIAKAEGHADSLPDPGKLDDLLAAMNRLDQIVGKMRG